MNFSALWRPILILATPALLAASCNPQTWGSASSTPSGPTAGNAVVIAVDQYQNTGPTCSDLNPYPGQAGDDIYNLLKGDGWNMTNQIDLGSLSTSTVAGDFSNDLLIFLGHGYYGVIDFASFCNGVGSSNYWGLGQYQPTPGGNFPQIPPNLGNITSNNLKWMIFHSSTTVAPDTGMDPYDQGQNPWTVTAESYQNIFYNDTNLRQILGYWNYAPGDDDVTIDTMDPVMKEFISDAWVTGSTQAPTLLDEWHDANRDHGNDFKWSAVYDTGAFSDVLSLANLGSLSRTLQFVSEYASFTESPESIPATTGTLEPVSLVNESLNVSGQVAVADSNLGLGSYNTTYYSNSTAYTTIGGLKVSYFNGASGGVTYHGRALTYPMVLSKSAAQTAATAFVNNSFGMPSDAVLSDTLPIYIKYESGDSVLNGYEFIWTHSSGTSFGGDAIKVVVDDDHYVSSIKCLQYEDNPPLKPICVKYTYGYADEGNISYGYRLWRSYGSGVRSTQSNYPSGSGTVDAYTASLATPLPDQLATYSLGYWTGMIDQATGIAEPAWIFRDVYGNFYAVDAGSGSLLGGSSI